MQSVETAQQCSTEHKTIQHVMLEQDLLTQERLDGIFFFENMISEIAVQFYKEIGQVG